MRKHILTIAVILFIAVFLSACKEDASQEDTKMNDPEPIERIERVEPVPPALINPETEKTEVDTGKSDAERNDTEAKAQEEGEEAGTFEMMEEYAPKEREFDAPMLTHPIEEEALPDGALPSDGSVKPERTYNAEIPFFIEKSYVNGEVTFSWVNQGVGPSAAILSSADGSFVQDNPRFQISAGSISFPVSYNPVGAYVIRLYTEVPLYGAEIRCVEKTAY